MKRISTFITTAVALALVLPGIAQAATGPWSWHDISPRVTYQTQRPVWAVAWSEDGWFYTDGINLWDGGQVYWFDGQTSAIVTLDVRNANIERVDDIVSDRAGTVLFLQDVVRNDNNFRIVAYRNDAYVNYTNTVKSVFDSNEAISSITGRNGEWMIVTTKGRLFRWYGNATQPQSVTLPNAARDIISTERAYAGYAYAERSLYALEPSVNTPVQVVPINTSEWLMRIGSNFHQYGNKGYVFDQKWYRISSNGTFSDVTNYLVHKDTNAQILGSNGQRALIWAFKHTGLGSEDIDEHIYEIDDRIIDGVVISDTRQIPRDNEITYHFDVITSADWNGDSWMLIGGHKNLYRLTQGNLEDYGETKDYFLTVAGSNDGEFLVGGTASEQGLNTPVFPLSAKLSRVIEDGGVSDSPEEVVTPNEQPSGDGVTDEGTGITTWQWLTPNVSEITENEDVTYTVGAWDADNIKRIQIVVNGDVKRTCELSDTSGNVECSHTIAANAYADNTNIFVNAQVWDNGDRYVWTGGRNVYNRAEAANTNDTPATNPSTGDTGTGISTVFSLSPNRDTLRNHEQITARAEAWDDDGIRRIDIYVNGDVRSSCTWNAVSTYRDCEYTLLANDYNLNTDVFVNAEVTDETGRVTWTNSRTVHRTWEEITANTSGDVSITGWFEGDTVIDPGDTVVFRTEARAVNGLREIKVFVDNEPAHTCSYNGAMGTVACNHSIYHEGRADGQIVRVRSRATDENGRIAWSDEKTAAIRTSNPAPNAQEGDMSVWDWLEPNQTEIELHETLTYHPGAWAENGIRQISVYVNGDIVRECNYASGGGNKDCWAELNGADYPVNTDVFVNARVDGYDGRVKWTGGKTIHVADNGIAHDEGDLHPGTLGVWSDHDSGIANNEILVVHASGNDPDGLDRIEIYVNAELVKTCHTQSCSVTAGPFNQYPYVTYAAKLVDRFGHVTWTGYKQIEKR